MLGDHLFTHLVQAILVTEVVQKGQARPQYLWNRPIDPAICSRQRYDSTAPVPGRGLYMRRVDMIESFSGLSVSHGNGTNMTFHAHNGLRPPNNTFHREVERIYGPRLVWLHFPVSAGERICGIWILTFLKVLPVIAVRMFRFNTVLWSDDCLGLYNIRTIIYLWAISGAQSTAPCSGSTPS
jgi:hypothetical protein